MATGDLDADGDLDILGAAGTDGLAWFQNDSSEGVGWTEQTIAAFAGAADVAVGDIKAGFERFDDFAPFAEGHDQAVVDGRQKRQSAFVSNVMNRAHVVFPVVLQEHRIFRKNLRGELFDRAIDQPGCVFHSAISSGVVSRWSRTSIDDGVRWNT